MYSFPLALRLASQHKLGTDDVFKARWASGPATEQGVADLLANVTDLGWVISQCITVVPPSPAVARALISHGLIRSSVQTCEPVCLRFIMVFSDFVALKLILTGFFRF